MDMCIHSVLLYIEIRYVSVGRLQGYIFCLMIFGNVRCQCDICG
jgi:hypothetical protein